MFYWFSSQLKGNVHILGITSIKMQYVDKKVSYFKKIPTFSFLALKAKKILKRILNIVHDMRW